MHGVEQQHLSIENGYGPLVGQVLGGVGADIGQIFRASKLVRGKYVTAHKPIRWSAVFTLEIAGGNAVSITGDALLDVALHVSAECARDRRAAQPWSRASIASQVGWRHRSPGIT